MPRPPSVLPTTSELEILRVIWQRGPSTVREVYRTLAADREVGYSTVLKFMQIMTEKGLVLRDKRGRTHVYRAAQPEAQTQRRLAGELMARAFGGSARKLVAAALSSRRATPAELDEIRKLIDEMTPPPKGGAS